MLMPPSPQITFPDFLKINIHTGTILSAVLNEKAHKPAYILQIDFGPELGIKTGSAQITQNYQPTDLINTQILAITNFPPKKVAGIKSEVLVLAAVCTKNGTILITPSSPVENGTRVL